MIQEPKNIHFYNKHGVEVDQNGKSLLLSNRTRLTSKLTRVLALAYPVSCIPLLWTFYRVANSHFWRHLFRNGNCWQRVQCVSLLQVLLQCYFLIFLARSLTRQLTLRKVGCFVFKNASKYFTWFTIPDCIRRCVFPDDLKENVLILGVIAVIGSGFVLVRGWAFQLAGYRIVSRMREELFEAIMRQEIGFFDTSRWAQFRLRGRILVVY